MSALDTDWSVYRDGGVTHLPGPNPGTPYTACMLDAGAMLHEFHPPTMAAVWCTECMRTLAGVDVGASSGVSASRDTE